MRKVLSSWSGMRKYLDRKCLQSLCEGELDMAVLHMSA